MLVKHNEIVALEPPLELENGVAVTIGNFDGCHLGHRKLIETTISRAKALGVPSLAISFSPNPKAFFGKYQEPPLFSDEQKIRSFSELGLNAAYIQHFDRQFSELSAEEFVTSFLVGKFKIKTVVVGYDFAFGHKRTGNAKLLEELGARFGFNVEVVPAQKLDDIVVSSGTIRRYLHEGNAVVATNLLGRPFAAEGIIRKGAQLGRTIGVPTANLTEISQLLPKQGVYVGHVYLREANDATSYLTQRPKTAHKAVINVGITPTVNRDETSIKVEAHLLDFSTKQELYGQAAVFYFEKYLRGEQKFSSLDALKQQIAQDIEEARRYF